MGEQDKHIVKVLRNIPRSIGGTSEIGLDGPWISDDGSPKIWRLFIREGIDVQIDDGDESRLTALLIKAIQEGIDAQIDDGDEKA
jgi:hypothetical protein